MSFLKVATIDAAQASEHPDILTRLRADDIQALVIEKRPFDGECTGFVADLEANRHGFPRTDFPAAFRSYFYGANLNLSAPDLIEYFRLAPVFKRALDVSTRPFGGFEARVFALLSQIDGGRSYAALPGPHHATAYMATTIRAHCEGGYIPAHFDNEQMQRPSFRDLARRIEGDLFSFVLTIGRAESGGTLEVFEAKADTYGRDFKNIDTEGKKPDLGSMERVGFDVANGTLVILQSGRYLHRVVPVIGARTRWTACSFMAKARDADMIACWG